MTQDTSQRYGVHATLTQPLHFLRDVHATFTAQQANQSYSRISSGG